MNKDLEKIIKEHDGLIDQIISEVKFNRLRSIDDHDDLKQQGRIALFKAAQAYEPEKGEFSHYASVAIRRELKRYASHQDKFHIPEHQFHNTNRLVAILDRMNDLYGMIPIDRVMKRFRCDNNKALQIVETYKMTKTMYADEISSYADLVPTRKNSEQDIEDFHKREHTEYIINTIANIYGEKYAKIIHAYFIKGMTLKEIGNVFGCTQERVRQITKKIDGSEPKTSAKDQEQFRILKKYLSEI